MTEYHINLYAGGIEYRATTLRFLQLPDLSGLI